MSNVFLKFFKARIAKNIKSHYNSCLEYRMPRVKNAKNHPKSKDKKLYKIGQLCEVLNISPRNLRYLEQLGFFPHLKRSVGKTRLYDESDLIFIKKIYELKNKKGYSFHKIKEILLKKNSLTMSEIAIITDASLSINEEVMANLCVLFLNHDEQKNEIQHHHYPHLQPIKNNDTLTSQLKEAKIKRVYALLSQSGHGIWKQSLQHIKIPDVKITIHKCNGFQSAAKLLSEQVIEAIINRASVNELDLLIAKQLPMTFSIGYQNSLTALFQNQNPPKNFPAATFIEQSLHFKAVFMAEKERINLEFCTKKEQDAITFIMEKLNVELENRGFYCSRVLIKHAKQLSTANKCIKHIQKLLPGTFIALSDMTLVEEIECGSNAVLITII